MKNFIKKYNIYIFSFLIPIILLLFILICRRVIFSDNNVSIFISDMRAQYIALFSYLKNINFEGFIYSFSNGLGGSMIGTFFYYLASPLNFIVFLFSQSNLQIAIIIILILKFSLSSLTMSIYLKKHFKKLNNAFVIMLSICYALMMYSVGYYFNIMWLDSIYLLPLLFLGIDKVVDNKKLVLYSVVLLSAIITNYYMGFILCISSGLYFIYRLIMKYKWKDRKKTVKTITRFIVVSILTGLAASFVLVPSLLEVFESSRTDTLMTNFPLKIDNILPGIFSRFFIGSNNVKTILNEFTPFVYCGLIILVLVCLYFFNKKINKKEKILFALIITVFLLSFSINYLNMIWHGFNFPAALNFRYSFVLCFFLIIISAKSLLSIKHVKVKDYYLTALILTIPASITIFNPESYSELYKILISLCFIYIYLLFIYCYNKYKDHSDHKLIIYLVAILSVFELTFSMYLCLGGLFTDENKEYQDAVNIIGGKINDIKNNDKTFYRMEKTLKYSMNDSLLLDYKGGNTFLSTLSGDIINFFNNVGLSGFMSSHGFRGDEYEIINSILGFKYVMYKERVNPYYELIDNFKYSLYGGDLLYNYEMVDINTYKNPYALNLGFMVNEKTLDFQKYFIERKKYNNLEFQNSIVNTMSNKEINPFYKSNITKIDDNNYEFTVTSEDDLYFYMGVWHTKDLGSVQVTLDDEYVFGYSIDSSKGHKIDRKYKIGDKVKVHLEANSDITLSWEPMIYHFNHEKFEEFHNMLKDEQMEVIEYKDNYIKGRVNVKDENVLFTSIPYHDYFDVYVDGKRVEKKLILDAFIGVELSNGEHIVEFKYVPKSFILGGVMSAVSLTLLGTYIIYEKKYLKKLD